jgi:hypothetical protein
MVINVAVSLGGAVFIVPFSFGMRRLRCIPLRKQSPNYGSFLPATEGIFSNGKKRRSRNDTLVFFPGLIQNTIAPDKRGVVFNGGNMYYIVSESSFGKGRRPP